MALPALGHRRTVAIPPPRVAAPGPWTSATRLLGRFLLAIYERITRTTPRSARITRDVCIVGAGVMLALCLAGIGVLVLQSDAATRH